jgi:archaemetzincin
MRRLWFAVVGLFCFVGLACNDSAAPAADPAPARSAGELAAIHDATARVKPLYQPKGTPQPGDWLESHPEQGQTFDQYLKSNPNRPTSARTTIYIQPLDAFNVTERKLLDETANVLGLFYNLPVRTLAPLGLDVIPANARRTFAGTGKEQLLTGYLLDDLLPPRRPADAVALLALTTSDLWPGEGWNFVFGQASLTERVGVWSSARYGDAKASDAAYRLCLLRMCKVATHETGHMLGIEHCTAYECGMNGSNNLPETDRCPLAFCPECSAKIWWSCGAQPQKWYGALAAFGEKHGFKEDAALWRKCEASLAN